MSTKKNSSMAAVDSALAKQKADFDKAVAAEVGIFLRGLLNDTDLSLHDYQRETLGHMIEQRESGITLPTISREGVRACSPVDMLNDLHAQRVGQHLRQFDSLTSELMGKITDLSVVVENLVDQLKPVTVQAPPPAGQPTQTVPQAQSEFVEFIECAGRRVDALREKISEMMGRITI